MMMVLPAPVSPESTLKPGPKYSAAPSMMAKLRMRSSTSIAATRAQPQRSLLRQISK